MLVDRRTSRSIGVVGPGRGPTLIAGVAVAVAVALGLAARRPAPPPAVTARAAVAVTPGTAAARDAVLALTDDVWVDRGGELVVVLEPAGLAALAAAGIPHRVTADDIDADARAERARLTARVRGADAPDWFSDYRDVREVAGFLDRLAARHPRLATLHRLGTSIEGWPIRSIEISRGGPIEIAIDGGHHAREWISVMVPLCIADRLLDGAERDPRIRTVLESVSFHVLPLINPDGYDFSWSSDRYWRKNRRGGYGVDLNRNYSVGWGGRGSSGFRASPVYRGEHAFSEPETQAVFDWFSEHRFAAHLDFHSYSQLVLYPWSFKPDDPPDRDRLAAAADRMVTGMSAAHGERYRILPGAELYGAAGTAMDWTYGERGALAFTVELRPPQGRGGNGFVLPPEQIRPTCDESVAAVLELADFVIRHPTAGSGG